MSENTDPLLPSEAQEASPIVPGIRVGAFGLGEDGDGLQIGKAVDGNGLRQAEKELSRLQDLHGNQRLPREPNHVLHQNVRLLPELLRRRMEIGRRRAVGIGSSGFRGVDSERSVGATEEELGAVGFDGLDLGRTISEELERIVRAVHHFRWRRVQIFLSGEKRANAFNDVVLLLLDLVLPLGEMKPVKKAFLTKWWFVNCLFALSSVGECGKDEWLLTRRGLNSLLKVLMSARLKK